MEVRERMSDFRNAGLDGLLVGVIKGNEDEVIERFEAAERATIEQVIEEGWVTGESGQLTEVFLGSGAVARRLFLVGMGSGPLLGYQVRDRFADALRALKKKKKLSRLGVDVALDGHETRAMAPFILEGVLLGNYTFSRYKKADDATALETLLFGSLKEDLNAKTIASLTRRETVVRATMTARDLANEPSNHLTPIAFSQRAQTMALESGLDCQIHDEADLDQLGMGLLLGVASGSANSPRVVELIYRSETKDAPSLILIGKGLTFDSGGISLKGSSGMQDMKMDKAGAAAVFAAMEAISELRPKGINVIGLLGLVENMPDGKAQKPGDIRTACNGKTVEIINTDAEGRLVLGDLTAYAVAHLNATWIVDVATLTGAVSVALGDQAAGIIATDDGLAGAVKTVGEQVGERFWRLPAYEEYKEQLKSEVADLKNSGGRQGAAISAGLFIEAFVEDTPWAHVDIAGVAWSDQNKGIRNKGASGFATATLALLPEYLMRKS